MSKLDMEKVQAALDLIELPPAFRSRPKVYVRPPSNDPRKIEGVGWMCHVVDPRPDVYGDRVVHQAEIRYGEIIWEVGYRPEQRHVEGELLAALQTLIDRVKNWAPPAHTPPPAKKPRKKK